MLIVRHYRRSPRGGRFRATGDVIARVAGKRVPSVDEIAVQLAELEPGQRVAVELGQPGGARTVQVALRQIPPA